MGLYCLLDASLCACVWDADPQPCLPERKAGRGRPETVYQAGNAQAKRYKLPDLRKASFAKHARERVIRQTTKGPLRARVWLREVWVWEDGSAQATARRLVVREKEDGELKVSWTNAPKEMS